MALAVTTEQLQQLLEQVAFTRGVGYRVRELGDGECTIAVPFQDAFERPGGIIGGPIFMASADVAMWLAIKTRLGFEDASVTAELKTNFLSAAARQDFRCTARVLKFGSRLIYGVAECTTPGGRLITHHTITYIRAVG
jgi:uncharacterized protein (TIGR00369 family)